MTQPLYALKELNPKPSKELDLGNCEVCGAKAGGFIARDGSHLKEFNLKKDIYTCESCFDKHVNGKLFFSDDGTTLVPLSEISEERKRKITGEVSKGSCDGFEIVEVKGVEA